MKSQFKPGDTVTVHTGYTGAKTGSIQRLAETVAYVKHYDGSIIGYKYELIKPVSIAEQVQKPYGVGLKDEFEAIRSVMEKTLTPAELKKREEIAQAIERENPDMPMGKKMAIATTQAKKVAEEIELDEQDLSKMSTEKLQKHWDTHKDQANPSPVFASQLKRVAQELAKRKKQIKEEQIEEAYDADDYEATHEKSKLKDGYRAVVKHKATGRTSYVGGTAYKTKEHAEGEAETYRTKYVVGSGKASPGAYLSHDRAVAAYRKQHKDHIVEGVMDTVKKAAKKVGEILSHGDDEQMRKDLQKKMGIPQTGKPAMAKQNEEAELDENQLDELSKATLSSYAKQAVGGMKGAAVNAHMAGSEKMGSEKASKYIKVAQKRVAGANRAVEKLAKEDVEHIEEQLSQFSVEELETYMQSEAFEQLDELSKETLKAYNKKAVDQIRSGVVKGDRAFKRDDGAMRAQARIFKTSNAPKAYTENVELDEEQLDELSKSTLGSYVKKANTSAMSAAHAVGSKRGQASDDSINKMFKRKTGVEKAADRLAKEETEIQEAMISYSDFQSKLDAHRKAGNKIKDDKYGDKKASYTVVDQDGVGKKITHTPSGTSQQHLGTVERVEKDESETTEKRGRGRPAGSKSGARK